MTSIPIIVNILKSIRNIIVIAVRDKTLERINEPD